MKKILLALSMIGAINLSSCTTTAEVFGNNTASLNATADKYYQEMVIAAKAKNKLDLSSMTYQRINTVFYRMIPYADQMNKTGHPFNWKLAVIKSDELNAQVAPGGKVIFFTGIVDKLNLTNEEIAAIMGHEMIHALEEHSKSKAGAEILTGLALSVAGVVVPGTTELANLGAQLGIGLPYSRHLESRADQGGLMLMARAGYNPHAAITLWEKMQRNDKTHVPAFLSTHPSNANRVSEMKKHLPAALALYQNRF